MRRLVAALGALLLTASSIAIGAAADTPRAAAATPAVAAAPAQPLTITILTMTPRLANATVLDQKITVRVQVTNIGSLPLTNVNVHLDRGSPLVRNDLLAQAVAGTALDQTQVQYTPALAATDTLDPGQSVEASIHTTPGSDPGGLCLCQTGVYPVDAVAAATQQDGTQLRATDRTFIPSFPAGAPQPVRVSWLWPLIDRPHRGISPTTFTDDTLATSVSPGGRLDRALGAVEALPTTIRVTLVVDPELIDALTTMGAGYRVTTKSGTHAGTGGPAARAWLARLKAVAPREDVSLSGYADPDVDAIVNAGLSWSTALDPQVAGEVQRVLGVTSSTLAWPTGEVLSNRGLDSVVGNGASLVLLRDTALQHGAAQVSTPDAIAPLPSFGGGARALVASTVLQRSVGTALSAAAQAGADLPLTTLLAQLAIQAAAQPQQPHFAVLAAPRLVDTDPAQAAKVITATSEESWAKPITIDAATRTFPPVDHGSLKSASDTNAQTRARLRRVAGVLSAVDSFQDCLTNDDAAVLLAGYASAIKRGQSSEWRAYPVAGLAYVTKLRAAITNLRAGVRLVQPSNAQYTLTSGDAPLYVTVENRLSRPVHIRVKITPGLGVQGFTTEPTGVQTIPAANGKSPSRKIIRVPAHVERSGRFQITVTLETPRGAALGESVPLRVHSTALGGVALWITGSALGVLVLAILIRLIRRFRYGPRHASGPQRRAIPSFAAGQ